MSLEAHIYKCDGCGLEVRIQRMTEPKGWWAVIQGHSGLALIDECGGQSLAHACSYECAKKARDSVESARDKTAKVKVR